MVESTLMADNLDAHGDEFYNFLMLAHKGLSEEQSHALNARLVLMLANEVGNLNVLKSIVTTAGEFNQS